MLWCLIGVPVAILVTPIVTFFAIIFGSSFYVFSLKKWWGFSEPFSHHSWDPQRRFIAKLFLLHGRIFHGYQIVNLDRIPSKGPALIICFHGTYPIDIYYLGAQLLLSKHRLMITVAYEKNFSMWGCQSFVQLLQMTPGSVDSCVETLNEGKLLCIAPGGLREQFFSHNYQVVWGERMGFAKIASQSHVPIIPVFTKNSQEPVKILPIAKDYFRQLYETQKIGFRLFHGCYPVKLTTYIGPAIDVTKLHSVEDIRQKAQEGLEDLIHQHQRNGDGIVKGICKRFVSNSSKLN